MLKSNQNVLQQMNGWNHPRVYGRNKLDSVSKGKRGIRLRVVGKIGMDLTRAGEGKRG